MFPKPTFKTPIHIFLAMAMIGNGVLISVIRLRIRFGQLEATGRFGLDINLKRVRYLELFTMLCLTGHYRRPWARPTGCSVSVR